MDDQLKYYKQRWNLSDDGNPFTTHSSLLQPVLFNGIHCFLKIALGDEERRGNGLMAWYNSDTAAPVLQYDGVALLMERAIGELSLIKMAKDGRDDEASRIVCSVVAKLHTSESWLTTSSREAWTNRIGFSRRDPSSDLRCGRTTLSDVLLLSDSIWVSTIAPRNRELSNGSRRKTKRWRLPNRPVSVRKPQPLSSLQLEALPCPTQCGSPKWRSARASR